MNVTNTMKALQKLAGAVQDTGNPFSLGVQSPSPSVNFCFGNTHLLPFGYSVVLYGPQKGGKSLLANSMIGQLHRDDPEAIAVKFDAEFREKIQLTPQMKKLFGIDDSRYQPYETNSPKEIFDTIDTDIDALCGDGAKIKLIVIDSINSIIGRRMGDSKSVEDYLIGDQAQTIQDGLKRILKTIRRHNIAVILISQVRAEMDQTEIRRGNSQRMAASFGVKHFAEYFLFVEPNLNAAARKDAFGNDLIDSSVSAGIGVSDGSKAAKGEQTAHKIRVTMKDSSCGPKGRVGQFTLDYKHGIVNLHEEVFELAIARNVITNEKGNTWAFKDVKWTGGKPSVLDALKGDEKLQVAIVQELKRRDLAGSFSSADEADLKAMLTQNIPTIE